MAGYIGPRSGNLTTTVADVQGDIKATDTTPEVTIINNTHEDSDSGREGKVIFKGQQSGGEESTLAEIEANHHGSSDDEKGQLVFKTNDGNDGATPTEAMRINSLGNVGIGTASVDVSTQAGGSGYKALQIESDEGGQLNFDHNDAGTGSTLGQINFQRAGEVVAEIEGVTDGATDNGRLSFRTQPDGGALTERMRIDHDGKVGIGSGATTPSAPLHVETAAGADWLARFENTTSGTPYGVNVYDAASSSNGYPLLSVTNNAGSAYFRVDSGTGYVTKPKVPSFMHASSMSYSVGTTGDTVMTNSNVWSANNAGLYENGDSGWDFSTGVFTAPVAGTYLFYVGWYVISHSNHRMMLQVNGGAFSTPYVNGYNTGNGSGTPTTCGSQFLSLSANDYVEVYTDGAFTPYGTHLGWGGTLLG